MLLSGTSVLGVAVACVVPCDRLAASSLELELVDRDSDTPVVDANITYRVDGEAGGGVDELGAGRYVVGVQEIGTFEVVVEAAGYVTLEREYEVAYGECKHADTVHDRLEMTRAP